MDSEAQAEQVRSVAVELVGPVIGQVPAQVMAQLDEAFRLPLHLQRSRDELAAAPPAGGQTSVSPRIGDFDACGGEVLAVPGGQSGLLRPADRRDLGIDAVHRAARI